MELDGITYNLGNASDARVKDDLERLATLRGSVPRWIGVQEAGDRDRILPRPGWRVLQGSGEGREKCVLLVHRSLPVLAWDYYLLTDNRWVGECHGLPTTCDTKWIVWARVDTGPRNITIANTHLVPGVQANCPSQNRRRALYRDQVDRIVAFERGRTLPITLVGDFNCVPDESLLAPLHRPFNVRYDKETGRDIDLHWFQPSDSLRASQARALPRFSSDHDPILVTYNVD